jgi:hypothetical protein
MIFVKKGAEDSTQKLLSLFMKRVKKSNLVSRARKSKFQTKSDSPLRKKQKALQRKAYETKKALAEKLSNI